MLKDILKDSKRENYFRRKWEKARKNKEEKIGKHVGKYKKALGNNNNNVQFVVTKQGISKKKSNMYNRKVKIFNLLNFIWKEAKNVKVRFY